MTTATFMMLALVTVLFLIALGAVFLNKNRAMAVTCPCTVFTTTPTPGTFHQPGGIEVGFKFRSSIDGYISGVRFFKGSNMGSTHSVSLWSNTGQRIAQADSTTETPTGWQEVTFAPIAITANTIYTASVFMPDGQYTANGAYFTGDIINGHLTAPRSGMANDANGTVGQGVYNTSGASVYPNSSFNASNYWVDVTFMGSTDSSPPEVTTVTPDNGANDTLIGKTIGATFDRPMDTSSLSSDTFFVKDASNVTVAGTVSYDPISKKAAFVTPDGLEPGITYTATIKGGVGTVAQSLDGVPLAEDYVWTFTTEVEDSCPCMLMDGANPAGSQTFSEPVTDLELGVKVVPEANGYLQAIRFYKPIINDETTHTGHVWSKNGTELANVTFASESEYGWQEARLTEPLRVYEGEVYIVSYGTNDAIYTSSIGMLNDDVGSRGIIARGTGDSLNAASGSGNSNGAFSSTTGVYPSSPSNNASYYWIDTVFTHKPDDYSALEVQATQPTNGSYGVLRSVRPAAVFNRQLDAGTVDSSSVRLLRAGSPVAGVPSYDSDKKSIVFTPDKPLDGGQAYTLRIGVSVADTSGVTLGSAYEVSFTVGAEHAASITEGLGGPVLVLTSSADPYGQYYSEILRTEGITYFDVKDISELSSQLLKEYEIAVMAETSLMQQQVDTISAWVTNGGNVIAMRPDKKLASLLGLSDSGSSRTNQYLEVNTTVSPGAGIAGGALQFKGAADDYTLSGATSVANLYSDASTATLHPAVSYRDVGTKGGTAAAFTYDLAKSIIAQHQGNRVWAGTERDGSSPIRTNDLFYGPKVGDIQPDWTDMNNIHIPQADEQQRLFVNVMTKAVKDSMPMPRFWYLPHGHKAALVMAGDDHALPNSYGTESVMNTWLNESEPNCSLEDWECVRASHYIYDNSGLTNARAVQYDSHGFELGVHPLEGCGSFLAYESFRTQYLSDLDTWRAKYTGLPDAQTSRVHCYSWGGWSITTQFEHAHNIRYDLNYVAFPGSWIDGRGTLITGSGMNMRLTLDDGSLANVRQGVTNLDNTSAPPAVIQAALDSAIGPAGYYGVYGTHYDMNDDYDEQLFEAARARNIPMITSRQAADWFDGREQSEFDSLLAETGRLTFNVKAAEQADGLKAMVPLDDAGGTLTLLKRGGTSVSYQSQTIKGVGYAVFDAVPGSYEVRYSDYSVPDDGEDNAGSPENNGGDGAPGGGVNDLPGDNASVSLSEGRSDSPNGGENRAHVKGAPRNSQLDDETVDIKESREKNTPHSGGPNWLLIAGGSMLTACLVGGGAWAWRHRKVV